MARETAGFVLSFDIDACDPLVAPGVRYPERGGLTYREAQVLMEFAAEAKGVVAFEIVEVDPTLDKDGATSQVAIELVRTALGGRTV
jgi:arginase